MVTLISQVSKWKALHGYRTDLLAPYLVRNEVTVRLNCHWYFPRQHWSVAGKSKSTGSGGKGCSPRLRQGDISLADTLPTSKWVLLSIHGHRWLWTKPWGSHPLPCFPKWCIFGRQEVFEKLNFGALGLWLFHPKLCWVLGQTLRLWSLSCHWHLPHTYCTSHRHFLLLICE